MGPIVRISILRCQHARFARLSELMAEAEAVLRPGTEAMPGLISFHAGADEATSSLTNVSVSDSLEHARQLETFQPMLDSAKQFAAEGATFDRPIMNYATLWRIGGTE